MNIYSDKKNCSGCRACEQFCPKQCINMVTDEEGFLYPEIDEKICIQCGLCKKICKNLDNPINNPLYLTYALKNNKDKIRLKSSSGGVFYELAHYVLQENGIVFGAVFDNDFSVYQSKEDSLNGIENMMGSKYVQSDTRNTYSEAKECLMQNRLVLYSGTPCQIAGLRSYLQRDYDNLICVSVICHGVPSPEIWQRYLTFRKGEQFNNELCNVSFRDKKESWRQFHVSLGFLHNNISLRAGEDIYMMGFFQNLYLRPSCYNCRHKGRNNNSDIILGDYWGIESVHPQMDDIIGVSAMIVNTDKGKSIINNIINNFDYIESDYESVAFGNLSLISSVSINPKRESFFKMLSETNNLIESIRENLKFVADKDNKPFHQYSIIMKYLKNKLQGWSIHDFLSKYSYKRIVLYSITEFTELVLDDIENTGDNTLKQIYLCDLNSQKLFQNGFRGHVVISIDELLEHYQNGDIDCIIVCNLYHRNEIVNDFMQKGVEPSKIITLFSAIFSI